MCLAIKTNGSQDIPVSYLKRGFKRNPHGAGFAVLENEKIFVSKGYFNFEDFYNAYKPYQHLPGLVHFRYSTCGHQNYNNTHPFLFGRRKYAVIHNGHIGRVHPKGSNSDTAQFVHDVLRPMIKRLPMTSKDFKKKIRRFVGGANKLAFMSNKGEFVIINEKDGIWENNVWYSNADYRFIPPMKRTWRKLKGKFLRKWDKILSLDFLKQKA